MILSSVWLCPPSQLSDIPVYLPLNKSDMTMFEISCICPLYLVRLGWNGRPTTWLRGLNGLVMSGKDLRGILWKTIYYL